MATGGMQNFTEKNKPSAMICVSTTLFFSQSVRFFLVLGGGGGGGGGDICFFVFLPYHSFSIF